MGVHAARKERGEMSTKFEKQVIGPSVLYSLRNCSESLPHQRPGQGRICRSFMLGQTHSPSWRLFILQVVRLIDAFHGEWLTVGTLIKWLEATWDGKERAERSMRLAEGRARVRRCRVLMEAFEAWHVCRLQKMADEVINWLPFLHLRVPRFPRLLLVVQILTTRALSDETFGAGRELQGRQDALRGIQGVDAGVRG